VAFLWEIFVRDIPPELIIESVDAGVGAFIDLFEVDLRPYGGDVVRFHSGTNGFYNNVIWVFTTTSSGAVTPIPLIPSLSKASRAGMKVPMRARLWLSRTSRV